MSKEIKVTKKNEKILAASNTTLAIKKKNTNEIETLTSDIATYSRAPRSKRALSKVLPSPGNSLEILEAMPK